MHRIKRSLRDTIKKKAPVLLPIFDMVKTLVSTIEIPYLIRLNKQKKVFAICPNGIGEITFVQMYINTFMKKYNKNKVVLVVGENRRECTELFMDKKVEFLLIGVRQYQLICALCLSGIGIHLLKKLDNIYYFDSWHRQNALGSDFFAEEKRVMGLAENDSFLKPEDMQDVFMPEGYSNNIEDIVLLNPFSRTLPEIDLNVFAIIVEELSKKGYRCITLSNTDQQSAICHTKALKLSLLQAYSLSRRCKAIIGVRSGFMDLISVSQNNKIICLYSEDDQYSKYFSFSNCEWNKNIYEFFGIGKTFYEDVVRIIGE